MYILVALENQTFALFALALTREFKCQRRKWNLKYWDFGMICAFAVDLGLKTFMDL
jgi:hypothetical protein